jgi:hypothetical protein
MGSSSVAVLDARSAVVARLEWGCDNQRAAIPAALAGATPDTTILIAARFADVGPPDFAEYPP